MDYRPVVASHGPSTSYASSDPGQGGIVTQKAVRGSEPRVRNWKAVPTGMLTLTPASTATVSSMLALTPPHLAAAAEEVPDLLDRPVRNRD